MYVCTNESLSSIVKGLDVQPTDNVFAVGGSGDQAFALLEYVNSVTLVDYSPEAVEFIQKRVDFLKQGKLEEFLNFKSNLDKEGTQTRNEYFLTKNRLQKIASKLDNLTIVQDDAFSAVEEKEYTKIYLSNIFGYRGDTSIHHVKKILTSISEKLPVEGLIYVANHESLLKGNDYGPLEIKKWNKFKNKFFGNFLELYSESCLPTNLKVDGRLTAKARTEAAKLENVSGCFFYHPAVYRKVED